MLREVTNGTAVLEGRPLRAREPQTITFRRLTGCDQVMRQPGATSNVAAVWQLGHHPETSFEHDNRGSCLCAWILE